MNVTIHSADIHWVRSTCSTSRSVPALEEDKNSPGSHPHWAGSLAEKVPINKEFKWTTMPGSEGCHKVNPKLGNIDKIVWVYIHGCMTCK